MGRLQGKIAIITGGASGLGGKMSDLFVKEGATVIEADINEAAREKENKKEKMQGITLDVSNEDDWKNLVEQVEKEHMKIDILVNNAGVTSEKMLNSIDYKDWEFLNKINGFGALLGHKYVGQAMVENKQG